MTPLLTKHVYEYLGRSVDDLSLLGEIVSPGDKAQNLDASFDPVQVPKIAFKRRQSVNCANPCRLLRLFYRDIYPHAASQILSTVHATLT